MHCLNWTGTYHVGLETSVSIKCLFLKLAGMNPVIMGLVGFLRPTF